MADEEIEQVMSQYRTQVQEGLPTRERIGDPSQVASQNSEENGEEENSEEGIAVANTQAAQQMQGSA